MITNFKIESYAIDESVIKTKYKLKFYANKVTFDLNLPSAYCNAIRRTVSDEFVCKYMAVEKIETDDDFIITEFIQERIKTISIDQNVKLGYENELIIENKSDNLINVYTNSFKKSEIFNNFVLCTLNSQKKLYIKCVVKEESPYKYLYGMIPVAVNAAIIPINCDYNVPTTMNKCSNYTISYINNGYIDNYKLLNETMDLLISRFQALLNDLIISRNQNIFTFTIRETDTIGVLLVYTCTEKFDTISYHNDNYLLKFRVMSNDDIKQKLDDAIKEIIKTFTDIKKSIPKA